MQERVERCPLDSREPALSEVEGAAVPIRFFVTYRAKLPTGN